MTIHLYLLPAPLLPSPKNFNGSTTFVVEKIVRIWSEWYYGHPTDTTTASDRTIAIIGIKPWLPKFTDLLLPITMGASLTLLVTLHMLLATDRLTCTLVKLTTVAVKMATVGLLGPDALIYSITYNARLHNLVHSASVVRFPMPLGTLRSCKKNLRVCRAAFFAWRVPILSWPRIMCSQVRMLKFLEPSREMP